jgi:REP element-mobilizing transposase RayT
LGKQVELQFRTWGGKRAKAGRKPGPGRKGLVAHAKRPTLAGKTPVHITMRAVRGTWQLREQIVFKSVRRQLAKASRGETRIVHFSVQRDHLHLIVEAPDRATLARRMQGLASGIARVVNGLMKRRGQAFWRGRYHREDLGSPRAVRNRLVYILMNHRKHHPDDVWDPRAILDPCTSAIWLVGWNPRAGPWLSTLKESPLYEKLAPPELPVRRPQFWLTATGWKRRGLIDPTEEPKPYAHRVIRSS